MSPHFFELTGISREQWEAEPHPWYARTHPDDYAVVHRAYEDCLAGQGEFYECDYRLRTPSGWMWLHDRGHVAERDDAGRPRTIAGTSQDASWRKRMEQALLESARSERRQLNDELHDGLGQELSGVQFMLAGIATQLRRDGSPQAAEVELTLALIGQALATTRSISRGLEPSNPKSGGLRAALQQLAADLSAAHGTDICFEAPDPTLPTVPDPAADHLFRMAREALIDACQRGGMGVVLGVHEAGGALEVSIVDAGPAQVAGVERSPDLGLRILAYRARMIGAQLHHAAGPPGRRCLRIRYPLAAWQDAGRA
jgi:signal transduction histidine kinase